MIISKNHLQAIKCWWNGHMEGKKNIVPGFGYYPICIKCNKQMEFVMDEYWVNYIRGRMKEARLIR